MPVKSFLSSSLNVCNTYKPPEIKYSICEETDRVLVLGTRSIKLLIDKTKDSNKFMYSLKDTRIHIEDVLVPVFLANCFNVTVEYVYSIMTASYEKELEKILQNFTTEEFNNIYEKTNDTNQCLYITMAVVAGARENEDVYSIMDFERNFIKRSSIGNTKFKLSLFLGSNDKKIYNVVDNKAMVE